MLQSNQVLSFFRPRENGGDWNQRELAEFYRVENALIGSGVSIATDRGVTDEGEPWFVFYRQDNEEVIVHFARIDGEYIVVSNLTEGVVRGRNFQALVRELLESHPYVLPKSRSRNQTVYLHPAALLAALIVTGYVRSAELSSDSDDQGRSEKGIGWVFNRHDLVSYSAIVIAAIWDTLTADSSVSKFADFAWLDEVKADYDVIDLSAGHQAVDGNFLLGDLFFKNVQDHSLLAAATVNFEGSVLVQSVKNEWSVAGSEAKGFGNEAAPHTGDHDLRVSAHDISQSAKEGAGEAAGWHSDLEQVDLLQMPSQLERTVAKSGSSTAAEASLPPDSHNSSTPSASASIVSPSPAGVPMAQNVVMNTLNALHIDGETFHPIVLPATNLQDVIQVTLAELTQENPTNGIVPLNGNEGVNNSQVLLFDESAQNILSDFLHDTPNVRIETIGNNVLIVDMDKSHFIGNEFTVKVWTMDDGSTLSILGIVHDHHALA